MVVKMTKEEREQKQYEEWKQRGLERGFPEKKLTLESYRKSKLRFVAAHCSNVNMNEWNY